MVREKGGRGGWSLEKKGRMHKIIPCGYHFDDLVLGPPVFGKAFQTHDVNKNISNSKLSFFRFCEENMTTFICLGYFQNVLDDHDFGKTKRLVCFWLHQSSSSCTEVTASMSFLHQSVSTLSVLLRPFLQLGISVFQFPPTDDTIPSLHPLIITPVSITNSAIPLAAAG